MFLRKCLGSLPRLVLLSEQWEEKPSGEWEVNLLLASALFSVWGKRAPFPFIDIEYHITSVVMSLNIMLPLCVSPKVSWAFSMIYRRLLHDPSNPH